jgi:hypothetical protein
LLQAERELGANLEQLASTPAAARRATCAAAAAAQHLGKLSLARDKLVSSGRAELADDVEREVATSAQASSWTPCPCSAWRAESGADDFAAMMGLENTKAPPKMPASASSVNCNSLLTRYPAELQRTREQIQQRADLAAATHLKIAAVQQAIAGLEPVVRAQHGQIQGEVRLMQGVMIGLILLIALLIDTLQRAWRAP